MLIVRTFCYTRLSLFPLRAEMCDLVTLWHWHSSVSLSHFCTRLTLSVTYHGNTRQRVDWANHMTMTPPLWLIIDLPSRQGKPLAGFSRAPHIGNSLLNLLIPSMLSCLSPLQAPLPSEVSGMLVQPTQLPLTSLQCSQTQPATSWTSDRHCMCAISTIICRKCALCRGCKGGITINYTRTAPSFTKGSTTKHSAWDSNRRPTIYTAIFQFSLPLLCLIAHTCKRTMAWTLNSTIYDWRGYILC